MRARVRLRGVRATADRILELSRAGGEELASGLRVIGESIATDVRASRPGAGIPKDEGILASSVEVLGPVREGAREKVVIGAGGAAVAYALRQHEELDWRHDLGEARYFVRAFERWQAGGEAVDAMQALGEALERRAGG